MISGLHHVTVVVKDAQRSYDFYTQVLGLHLVKQTVHYDDLDSYHLYFGDAAGSPGSLLTCFVFPTVKEGGVGKGQITTVGFRMAQAEIDTWTSWLEQQGILYKWPQQRGQETVIFLEDPDGVGIELIASPESAPLSADSERPRVRGLYSAEAWLPSFAQLGAFFTHTLGFTLVSEQGQRFRYGSEDRPGHYFDLLWGQDGVFGMRGTGTIDHIALRVPDMMTLQQCRIRLKEANLNPTPIRERTYFQSIYVEPVPGVLVELATDGPGFAVDEDPNALGQAFQVPRWEAFRKEELRAKLPELRLAK